MDFQKGKDMLHAIRMAYEEFWSMSVSHEKGIVPRITRTLAAQRAACAAERLARALRKASKEK